jgi:hypothetical protein
MTLGKLLNFHSLGKEDPLAKPVELCK